MRLRQRIRVNVSGPGGGEETVLKTARTTLRSRLLRRFVGDQYAVLVLTPVGMNVDAVEIRDALAEIIQNQKAFIPTNGGKNVGLNVGIKVAGDVGINRDAVIKILKKQPHSTAKSLAEATNLSPRQVERVLAELKKEGKIVRKGSNKAGWWEVN